MNSNNQNPSHKHGDDSVEDLLMDLETVIKGKNYEFPREEEIFCNNYNEDDEEEYHEDFVLKEIEFCENDQEMQELLEIEESKLIFSNEKAYEFLYRKNLKKSFTMMKIIKKFLDLKKNNTIINEVHSENKDLRSRIKSIQQENMELKKEKNNLSAQKNDLCSKIKEINLKYEKKRSTLKIYKGDKDSLQSLDFETILDLEKRFQKSLKNIASHKTKVENSLFLYTYTYLDDRELQVKRP